MAGRQYNVQIQDPTAVTHCTWCQLAPDVNAGLPGDPQLQLEQTQPSNLVVAKSSKLYVYYRHPDVGLQPELVLGVSERIFGRVVALEAFRLPGWRYDCLFILTEEAYHILKYNDSTLRIETLAHEQISERGSMRCEAPIVAIDPACKMILIHTYQSTFEMIFIDEQNHFNPMVSTRASEVNIRALCFLPMQSPIPSPIIVSLYGKCDRTFVKGSVVEFLKNQKNAPLPEWCIGKETSGFTMMEYIPAVATPDGAQVKPAILMLGERGRMALLTEGGVDPCNAATRSYGDFVCCARLTNNYPREFIVGDSFGQYALINVDQPKNTMLRDFGKFGVASCMAVIAYEPLRANGELYIGSCKGDSELIEFDSHTQPRDCVQARVAHSYTNLGPIIDFCVVDEDLSASFGAPGRFFTCSGTGATGSLRIAEIGIGVERWISFASSARRVFTVYENGQQRVLTSSGQSTNVFQFARPSNAQANVTNNDSSNMDVEMVDVEAKTEAVTEILGAQTAILLKEPTVWCGNSTGGNVVQVTHHHILHGPLDCAVFQVPARVVAAHSVREHLVVALLDKTLLYYNLVTVGPFFSSKGCTRQVSSEISCVTTDQDFIAVGYWDFSVEVFAVPVRDDDVSMDVEQKSQELVLLARIFPTGNPEDPLVFDQSVVRSLLLHSFENRDTRHLFAGFSRGMLRCYTIACNEEERPKTHATLSLVNTVCLGGRRPAVLLKCDPRTVMVSAQQPVIIQSKMNAHLQIDKLNLKDVTFAARIPELDDDDDAFVFLCENTKVMVGAIVDMKPTLYVRTKYVGNSPSHIAFHKQSYTLCISVQPTVRETLSHLALEFDHHPSTHPIKPLATLQCFCPDTLKLQSIFQLGPQEQVGTLLCANFSNPNRAYLIAGTVYLVPEEPEPKRGRVVLLTVTPGMLSDEALVSGDVVDDNHAWRNTASMKLAYEIPTNGAVYSLKKVRDKLAGTVNNAVIIWSLEPHGLVQLCTHEQHIVALHLDVMGDLLLVGDIMRSACLLTLRDTADGNFVLEEVARNWNCMWLTAASIQSPTTFIGADDFRNLTTFHYDPETSTGKELKIVGRYNGGEFINQMQRHDNVIYWASLDGALGYIRGLTDTEFTKLLEIQNRVIQYFTESSNTLGIDHGIWRSFQKEQTREDHSGYIDGDLLKAFVTAHETKNPDGRGEYCPSSDCLVGQILEHTRFDFGGHQKTQLETSAQRINGYVC
eukprot:GEMP01004345.1.p1 GENE.GEMP01004345.1~~GEMP01004345.1.p1  ORF type:complete len:1222 (+),score=239.99 GEMP01004345.1:226-3891(+)